MRLEEARELRPLAAEDFDLESMSLVAGGVKLVPDGGLWLDAEEGDVLYALRGGPMLRGGAELVPVRVLDDGSWRDIATGEAVSEGAWRAKLGPAFADAGTIGTAQAAEILGVTRARVSKMCADGVLAAEKVGCVWYIRRDAVMRRAANPPRRGRAKGRGRCAGGR